MNLDTAKKLVALNNNFYRQNSQSFSAARGHAWHGWQNCLEILSADAAANSGTSKDGVLARGLASGASGALDVPGVPGIPGIPGAPGASGASGALDVPGAPGASGVPDAAKARNPEESPPGKAKKLPNFSIFDLACGNLRFEAFLEQNLANKALTFYAVDNCDALVPQTPAANYKNLDILAALQGNSNLNAQFAAPLCDLSVCFGFLHHAPLQSWREELLQSLVDQTRSGGYVIVSLWQFLNNPDLTAKAQETHARGLQELGFPSLDSGDYLLGWQNTGNNYRYCHSFSELEIDQLVKSVADKTTLVSRFVADGRSDNLNTYLILRVN